MDSYKRDCFKKRPFSVDKRLKALLQASKVPGAGLDKDFVPFETVEKDVSLVTVMHIFPRNETTEAIFAEDPAIFVGGVELVTEGIITGEIQVAHTNITSGIDRTL